MLFDGRKRSYEQELPVANADNNSGGTSGGNGNITNTVLISYSSQQKGTVFIWPDWNVAVYIRERLSITLPFYLNLSSAAAMKPAIKAEAFNPVISVVTSAAPPFRGPCCFVFSDYELENELGISSHKSVGTSLEFGTSCLVFVELRLVLKCIMKVLSSWGKIALSVADVCHNDLSITVAVTNKK